MKIAIDISPLSTGHKVRGVGFYLRHLKDALEKYYPQHTYVLFKDSRDIPEDVDLIHYPYFDPFTVTQPLLKKKPTVVTVHDLTPLRFPEHFPSGIKGRLKWQLNKGILRTMDALITDSECSQNDVVEIVGVKSENVRVVHLAAGEQFKDIKLQNDDIRRLIDKYNIPEIFALYVGDVTWNKNLPRLVEAVLQLNSQSSVVSPQKSDTRPQVIPLVMVGKALAEQDFDHSHPWNSDLVKVQKMIEGKSTILPLGFVEDEDLVALYNAATVFVFPSLYEGFGLPVLEAMACGTPVVTSREGSLEEVAGEAAYFVDPESVESISLGLERVWKSKEIQKELQEKGLKRVQEFSWHKTASETIKVYEKVLKNINDKT